MGDFKNYKTLVNLTLHHILTETEKDLKILLTKWGSSRRDVLVVFRKIGERCYSQYYV